MSYGRSFTDWHFDTRRDVFPRSSLVPVIPAEAGIHGRLQTPAFAGMTKNNATARSILRLQGLEPFAAHFIDVVDRQERLRDGLFDNGDKLVDLPQRGAVRPDGTKNVPTQNRRWCRSVNSQPHTSSVSPGLR